MELVVKLMARQREAEVRSVLERARRAGLDAEETSRVLDALDASRPVAEVELRQV